MESGRGSCKHRPDSEKREKCHGAIGGGGGEGGDGGGEGGSPLGSIERSGGG